MKGVRTMTTFAERLKNAIHQPRIWTGANRDH